MLLYSQSDVAFGCLWVMSRSGLFSVPVPQGHRPLRENSVYHCVWQPRSQPDAVILGGPQSWQRWLIPPQWLTEELQGEAIYNQTFQVQCSSIFIRKGTRMRMAHKTSQIQINPHPNIVPRAMQPPADFSQHLFQVFCSAVWVLWCWCKILVITHQLLKEQGDNCEYHQCEQNTNSFYCSFEADTCWFSLTHGHSIITSIFSLSMFIPGSPLRWTLVMGVFKQALCCQQIPFKLLEVSLLYKLTL